MATIAPESTTEAIAPLGLSSREAERRLVAYGRNELIRRAGRRWPRQLMKQVTHPLALLLWVASGLAFVAGTPVLGAAIVAVIVLNAVFAFAQEQQAERAIEALRRYLPQEADVLRDGRRQTVDAVTLVPGDVLLIAEGDRISADARLLAGAVDVDLSTLTGESQPVFRSTELHDPHGPPLEARHLVFSGTSCVGGEATALVTATGMQTELGRIAALTEQVEEEPSPLERQVRRVAKLIALVAVVVGLAFLPIGWLRRLTARGRLQLRNRVDRRQRARGIAADNHARLGGRRRDARAARRARQAPQRRRDTWLGRRRLHRQDGHPYREPDAGDQGLDAARGARPRARTVDLQAAQAANPVLGFLGRSIAACSTAELAPEQTGKSRGEATEIGLLEAAQTLGVDVAVTRREHRRRALNRFDPKLRLMSTVDERDDGGITVHAKGAPEEVLLRSTMIGGPARSPVSHGGRP